MQVVILAGGMGVRMGEDTLSTPKPMIRIGGMPIIWHLMKNLHSWGLSEFIILGGYKIEAIREFFRNYHEYRDQASVYGVPGIMKTYQSELEDWSITVVNTGEKTLTGGRLDQARPYLYGDILLTYADGLANVDIPQLRRQAMESEAYITVTAVHSPGRFGALDIKGKKVLDFKEKPLTQDFINGGFWYMKQQAFDTLKPDEMLEMGYIQRLIKRNKVEAYIHQGFWHPMDTGRDKEYLTSLWESRKAPWKNWGFNE